VRPFGELLHRAQRQDRAVVHERVAAVEDPGDPERALAEAQRLADAKVQAPGRTVAEDSCVAAR
jgi:hypothetical protein